MPTTSSHVRKLVDRLVTLPAAQNGMFDKPEEERKAVRTELGRAIERHAKSDCHASAIVDQLMEGRFRPVPGDVRDTAAATMPAEHKDRAPSGCQACHGQPWRVDVSIGLIDGRPEIISGGARRCDCELGRYLAAKDAARVEALAE